METGAELKRLGGFFGHTETVTAVQFLADGRRAVSASEDRSIRLWDLANRQEVCELRGHESYVHAVAFSPDGTRLASGSGDSTVRIWDTISPSVRAQSPTDFRRSSGSTDESGVGNEPHDPRRPPSP